MAKPFKKHYKTCQEKEQVRVEGGEGDVSLPLIYVLSGNLKRELVILV